MQEAAQAAREQVPSCDFVGSSTQVHRVGGGPCLPAGSPGGKDNRGFSEYGAGGRAKRRPTQSPVGAQADWNGEVGAIPAGAGRAPRKVESGHEIPGWR
jgi:hypothetical protein